MSPAQVAGAYIDLRAVQARRAVIEENLATSRQLLKLAKDARQAGLGSDLDTTSASAAAASIEAELPPLDQQGLADKNRLALLLAENPGALVAELSAAAAIPPVPPVVPIGLPSDLARRRPDIRRAEAQLHAAVARQGVAVAMLYPSFSLNTAGGFQASRPAALTEWAAHYLTLGASLDIPIFDGGQRRANVRLADTRTKKAALAYAQTVLSALTETEDAIDAYGQEQTRRASLETALAQSRSALALAQARYAAGSVSFREVLEAQEKLQQAQLASTASLAATAEDLVTLYRTLGGGWDVGADAHS